MNNIILYGIGDARYQYRVLRYFAIYDERADTSEVTCVHDHESSRSQT